jgi:hypothetical protein
MSLKVESIEKLQEFSTLCDKVYDKVIDSIAILESDDFEHEKSGDGRRKYFSVTNMIQVVFEDGSRLRIFDSGQDCCEHRYITSDDVGKYSPRGHRMRDVVVRSLSSTENDCCGYNDIQFIEITTSGVGFDFEIHNDHNGYYAGFSIEIEYIPGEEQ